MGAAEVDDEADGAESWQPVRRRRATDINAAGVGSFMVSTVINAAKGGLRDPMPARDFQKSHGVWPGLPRDDQTILVWSSCQTRFAPRQAPRRPTLPARRLTGPALLPSPWDRPPGNRGQAGPTGRSNRAMQGPPHVAATISLTGQPGTSEMTTAGRRRRKSRVDPALLKG